MHLNKLLLGALALKLQLSIATPIASTLENPALEKRDGPICQNVEIAVAITATNQFLMPGVSITDLLGVVSGLVNSVFSILPVQATYTISGTYCEPEVQIASRSNTIQFLAHPATYDRYYWFGGQNYTGIDGTRYSWVSYASKQGYPTFSYDRLGNGQSQRPNGALEVQMATQAATVNAMIQLARQGASPFPRQFSKVIIVGASMGSLQNQVLMTNYPDAADAAIQTAFTKSWINVIPGFTVTAGLLPAATVDGARFPGLDPAYLLASSASGVQYLLFYGPTAAGRYFDPNFIKADYATRGTITAGEAVSGSMPTTAGEFTGPVYVMTGQQDVVFCGKLGLPTDPPSDCLTPTNQLAATSSLYPKASSYDWYAVPNSGHCWEHHYSALAAFGKAHDWLASKGF